MSHVWCSSKAFSHSIKGEMEVQYSTNWERLHCTQLSILLLNHPVLQLCTWNIIQRKLFHICFESPACLISTHSSLSTPARHHYYLTQYQGRARTQSPTTRNYAVEIPTFGEFAGVSTTGVQWLSLALGEPPSWSWYLPCQVSMSCFWWVRVLD